MTSSTRASVAAAFIVLLLVLILLLKNSCECSSRDGKGFAPLSKSIGSGACSALILSRKCEVSAVDEHYFETHIGLKLPPNFPPAATLEMRLCKQDGTPVNDWKTFFADPAELQRVLDSEKREGFVAFRTGSNDLLWAVKILEELFADENAGKPRTERKAAPSLESKLRKCGAARFSLDVICPR